MLDSERSTGTLLLALAAIALLGAALAQPWLEYTSDSGRRTPVGGYHDPGDTGAVTHRITYAPFHVRGDEPATNPQAAQGEANWVGGLGVAAIALLALAALGSLPRVCRLVPRAAALVLIALGTLAAGAALAIAWVRWPQTLAGYGIDSPFSAALAGDVYVRTTLLWGWALAALAVPVGVVAFGVQFQAGSTDPALVETLARREAAR